MNYKPDIAVFVESEIWPNLIKNCRRKNIPMVLFKQAFQINHLKDGLFLKDFLKVY